MMIIIITMQYTEQETANEELTQVPNSGNLDSSFGSMSKIEGPSWYM